MHPAMMMVRYHQCTLRAVLVILLGACTHYQSSQSISVACQVASFSQRIALLITLVGTFCRIRSYHYATYSQFIYIEVLCKTIQLFPIILITFCKLVHLTRATPTSLIKDALAVFDAGVRRTFCLCAGVDASNDALGSRLD